MDQEINSIIELALKGNQAAMGEIYRRFAPKLFALCLRYNSDRQDAEDALQDGFLCIFKNLSSFKGTGSFEGWMKRIVINESLKRLQNKPNFSDISTAGTFIEDVSLPDAISHLSEDELLNLIDSLPEGYKLVFNMYVIEGYSHLEIAEMLDINESTSRSQLVKARRLLQNKLLKIQTMTYEQKV